MFTVVKEWKEQGPSKTHYIAVYINTACCKDTYIMRIDGPKKIFWLDRFEYLDSYMRSSVLSAIAYWRSQGHKEPE